MKTNIIHVGDNVEILKTLPKESVDMCITSPPYWGLRDYGTEGQISGGDPDCEHEFESSTRKLHIGRIAVALLKTCSAILDLRSRTFFIAILL